MNASRDACVCTCIYVRSVFAWLEVVLQLSSLLLLLTVDCNTIAVIVVIAVITADVERVFHERIYLYACIDMCVFAVEKQPH